MELKTIAQQAELKGLMLVGTGDALHPRWLESIKSELGTVGEGVFAHPEFSTSFILTAEIEDIHRVHHLVLMPDLGIAEELRSVFSKYSEDIDSDGRAKVALRASEIVDIVVERGCAVGPAHAFTPWTSMYKEFNSLTECYGDASKKVSFLELGLSADTEMADRIPELHSLNFLSCSDAHSPWPDRLGREFNRLEIQDLQFSEVIKAINQQGGRKISLNVGFDPRLGKYHLTACTRCFKHYEVARAEELRWRCANCGGLIKKGVRDRVNELAQLDRPAHPEHRPPYLRIAPLAEVIALALGEKDTHAPSVGLNWNALVSEFGNEISVLIDAPVEDVERVVGRKIAEVIKAFRSGNLKVVAGGGGRYGRLELPPEVEQMLTPQRTLAEFGL
jgi:uncharacterized protein (TIGR00375 family)